MTKLLALICICFAISAVHADSCTDTAALRTLYGLSNSLSTATTYSDLQYCKSIKNTAVCCTNTQINSFKTKSDAVITNLTSVVSARDKFLSNAISNVIPNLKSSIATFKTNFAGLSSSLGALGGSGTDSLDFDDVLDGLTNITDSLSAAGIDLKTSFSGYQKSRQTCIVETVKLQNAAFCLACDASAASKGYSVVNGENDFAISDRVSKRIDTACSSYLTSGAIMSGVSQIAFSASMMTSMNDFIAKVTKAAQTGDVAALTDLMTGDALTNLFGGSSSSDPATGATTPVCEDETDCDNLVDLLFENGVVNLELLSLAGTATSADELYGSRRLLLRNLAKSKLSNDGGRMLDGSGSFDPDSDEAGVEVTFAVDPASTQSSSNNNKFGSLSFGNVIVSMMVVVSAIFLF